MTRNISYSLRAMTTDDIARCEFSKRVNSSQMRFNSSSPFTQTRKLTKTSNHVGKTIISIVVTIASLLTFTLKLLE